MMDTKEVYIVYDNKSKKYANYLAQLISTCSTRSEKKIVASCWSPDIYEHSLVEMTTENRVLFVGDSKELCAYTSEIKDTFNKHGMHYGWIGTQGVLRVDSDIRSLTRKYKEFCRFAQEQQQELKETFDRKNIVTTTAVAALMGPLFAVIVPAANLIKSVKRIADQKYICLVTVFYKDGLKEFLEGC